MYVCVCNSAVWHKGAKRCSLKLSDGREDSAAS